MGPRRTDTPRDAIRLWYIPGHVKFPDTVGKHWDIGIRFTRVTTLPTDGYTCTNGLEVRHLVARDDFTQTSLFPPSVPVCVWWG